MRGVRISQSLPAKQKAKQSKTNALLRTCPVQTPALSATAACAGWAWRQLRGPRCQTAPAPLLSGVLLQGPALLAAQCRAACSFCSRERRGAICAADSSARFLSSLRCQKLSTDSSLWFYGRTLRAVCPGDTALLYWGWCPLVLAQFGGIPPKNHTSLLPSKVTPVP